MFGFFRRYEVHLSPEVKGHIVAGGKPLEGAEVYRELFYEEYYVDKAVTDPEGRFSFPQKIIRSRGPGKLFGETHITQVITVDYQGATYLLWRTSTTNLITPQVLAEKLHSLYCKLETPEELQHFPARERPSVTHNIRTVCRWNSA